MVRNPKRNAGDRVPGGVCVNLGALRFPHEHKLLVIGIHVVLRCF